jgi:hypothetical protein
MLAKAALYTGIGPGIVIVYAPSKWLRADRVPTLTLSERWSKTLTARKALVPSHRSSDRCGVRCSNEPYSLFLFIS